MTLVVSCCVNRMPFLFGDLLLTGKTGPGVGVEIPTFPWGDNSILNAYVDGEGPLDIAQKVTICGSNMLLGWAGSHRVAHEVISGLYELNKDGNIDLNCLNEYLNNVPETADKELRLIGLHRSTTFHWFSFGIEPTTLPTTKYGKLQVIGSGTELFMSYKDQLDFNSPYYPVGSAIGLDEANVDNNDDVTPGYACGEAVSMVLSLCGNMLVNEICDQKSLMNFFGGGYEIGYPLNETGFSKLDGILYLFWMVDWEDQTAILPDRPIRGFQYS